MTAGISSSTLLLVACSQAADDVEQYHKQNQVHQTGAPAAARSGLQSTTSASPPHREGRRILTRYEPLPGTQREFSISTMKQEVHGGGYPDVSAIMRPRTAPQVILMLLVCIAGDVHNIGLPDSEQGKWKGVCRHPPVRPEHRPDSALPRAVPAGGRASRLGLRQQKHASACRRHQACADRGGAHTESPFLGLYSLDGRYRVMG